MVPFIIVTGFLGSGKTTLLNRLLAVRQAEGTATKLGLIVNELGDIGVDGELLPQSASRQIELPGGCVCCVLSDDLATTIVDMLDRNPEIEAIVLETTGVAEPLPLAWALERPPASERVRLAAVITLVDATGFVAARALSPAVDAQVAYGDVILLTKNTLADPDTLQATLAAVSSLAPRIELRIGSTEDHASWLHTILSDPHLEMAAEPHRHDHDHGHDHDHDHDECDSTPPDDDHAPTPAPRHLLDNVATLLPDVVVDLEELEEQLEALPANYVRIKGIVRAVDGRRASADLGWYAFHRVGLRVSSEPLAKPASPRVVALGRSVDIEAVKACIENAVVKQ